MNDTTTIVTDNTDTTTGDNLDTVGKFLVALESNSDTPFLITRDDTSEECYFDEYEEQARMVAELAERQGVFDLGEKKLPIVSRRKYFSVGAGICKKSNNIKSICLQFIYPDNTYSDLFEFSQTAFIKAGRKNFALSDKASAKIVNQFDDLMVSNICSNLARYISREDSVAVLRDTFDVYENLESIVNEPSITEVYSRIVAYIYRNKGDFHMLPYALDGKTYRIETLQFDRMMKNLDYDNPKKILKLLKKHNMLHLPPSSVGYQAKVKTCDGSINCYCIKKLCADYERPVQALLPDKNDIVSEVMQDKPTSKAKGIEVLDF